MDKCKHCKHLIEYHNNKWYHVTNNRLSQRCWVLIKNSQSKCKCIRPEPAENHNLSITSHNQSIWSRTQQ